MNIRNRWKSALRTMGGYMLSVMMVAPCLPPSPRLVAWSTAGGAAPTHGRAAIAYAYDAKAPQFQDRDARYLTHINWSFALIDQGRVSGDHWRNIDKLQAYKRKHPHIKTLVAIGGWGAEGFSQAAATAEGRKQFSASATELMQRYGFDGIDVDWEYPGTGVAGIAYSTDDKRNFTLLLAELRRALNALTENDGKKRLLTIACGAAADRAQGIECAAIAQYVDYVNIMSYDLRGEGVTGHHAGLYASSAVPGGASAHAALQAYERQGIPRKKLIIGAAFYGHMWKNVAGKTENGLFQPAGDKGNTTINYSAITNSYLNRNGYTRFWDPEARAPYLFNGANFISYEDEEAVYEKAAYARSQGLGGVMCWEYTHDPSGALLKAIDRGLRGN